MKLVLIGPVYPFRGGIAHYTTVLRNELASRGHEVLLISFRRQYPAWLFPGKTDRDPSASPLEAPSARYILDLLNPWTWWQAIRAIRAYRPQRVVLQWWQALWAPVWLAIEVSQRATHTPVTVICHNVLPHERRPLDAALARAVLGLADRALVQSASECDDLHGLLPRKPVDVVPHPLYDMLAGQAITRDEARRQLGVDAAGPVLLFFGFVRDYKGLDYLLAAMPAVIVAFPDVRLLVAGEFWKNRAKYEAQIGALEIRAHVTLVDRYIPNEEAPLYFAAANLVTLPYASATQSGVLQMALGFDRPVVATRVGGLADVIEEGDDVTLVEPCDPAALAEAIIAFLRMPVSRGVAASRVRGKERWGQVVDAVARER
jgi:glycosyltransferase involved in cell wall biosynthesis